MKKCLLVIGFCLFVMNSFSQSAPDTDTKDFEQFWSKWQTAIVKKDFNTVSQYIDFPLVVKKGEGTNSVMTVARKDFTIFFKQFLDQPAPGTPGENRFATLKGKKLLDEEDRMWIEKELATVGDFEFQKVDGKWKLIYIYDIPTETFAGK
ncbi:hypothetical protein COR50_06170 [Chitinophaga caeni]|uniref:DUF4440 domain-containing protein n=1 Tax=Chitinophaga caeni TaxID=2029983 RepID=A0A291QS96_9BACT|nr:hypothetical protein [Chitinophaga caeni]ATL46795.1 hypothetical protein COR50_06170 [Chitinophaga caeni]